MARTIDQIRASKLPSNMMQFAARGALQVPPAENIEILVYLAVHNKVFGELARMTLAGWDEKSCLAAASDPHTNREVLDYFIAPDNVRPKLLPALLENPSVPEAKLVKLATSAMRDTVEVILKSGRALSLPAVVDVLKSNPYLKKGELELLRPKSSEPVVQPSAPVPAQQPAKQVASADSRTQALAVETVSASTPVVDADHATVPTPEDDEAVTVYIKDHAADIAAEGEKPFQAIGGVVELLGHNYFPVLDSTESPVPAEPAPSADSTPAKPAVAKTAAAPGKPPDSKRENTLQKINRLDVKGRIQLALKGSKEERSILIRDGTKVVAFAVLEAPKLSDGEVEKFASQKNVLETVLRQITLKRRFMKNYIVIRNLCANPRTPLDLGLGLMKNLLIQDLKNISANKEVSETIRKLALKMYKQKLDEANKK
jgi:hypothetical protein